MFVKGKARQKMAGNYGTLIFTLIIQAVIIFALTFGAADLFQSYLIYCIAVVLIDLLGGVVNAGRAYQYMNLIYDQSISVSDLFHGFKENADKAIIIRIPFAITSFMAQIPYSLYLYGVIRSLPLVLMICTVSAILFILCSIYFGQSLFLLQDFPDKSAVELLKLSAAMMKGHALKYFLLYLSFLPVFILGCITLFIPLLWVECYIEASRASFYRELIVTANTKE